MIKGEILKALGHLEKNNIPMFVVQLHMHRQKESYHHALSLSAPPVSFASVCPLRLPGFLCGAPEFQMLIHSAGRFAPEPPPLTCVGRWNCSGKSTGSKLYCCQIPVDKTEVEKGLAKEMPFVLNKK